MVYFIPYEEKLHHAQYYLGFVENDLLQRIALHQSGRGAKLLAAVNAKGIKWKVVRVWLFTIVVTDGNDHVIASQQIPYSNFPYDSCSVWFVYGVLLLPSEY